MNILALDASSGVASVALLSDDVIVGEYTINHKKTHSQTLMPMINQLLASIDFDISEIDIFAASVGPGSFTGLRIGLATIKGLAHACDRQVVGVSTLEAMAYNLPCCDKMIVPILDARRDQVYGGVYRWKDEELLTIIEPCALSIDELLAIIQTKGEPAIFIGDGVVRFKGQIEDKLAANAEFTFANSNLQRAASVAVLANKKFQNGEGVSCEKMKPIYLRKSQAEREYDEKKQT